MHQHGTCNNFVCLLRKFMCCPINKITISHTKPNLIHRNKLLCSFYTIEWELKFLESHKNKNTLHSIKFNKFGMFKLRSFIMNWNEYLKRKTTQNDFFKLGTKSITSIKT